MKYIYLWFLLLIFVPLQATDLIVFSYNRPMQLYAFLESLQNCATGVSSVSVLYRSDDEEYNNGYQEVQKSFPDILFSRQGNKPAEDFKQLTLELFEKGTSEYIVFGVDDIILTRPFDVRLCAQALKKTDAYCFILRLGKNVNCIELDHCALLAPALHQEDTNIYSWIFSEGKHDWAYPHNVDMTVYKKSDIKSHIYDLAFQGPNSFEANWTHYNSSIMQKKGLCFEHSVMVNIPTNRVQTFGYTWSSEAFSPQELLKLFFEGKKINVAPLFMSEHHTVHAKHNITFKKR